MGTIATETVDVIFVITPMEVYLAIRKLNNKKALDKAHLASDHIRKAEYSIVEPYTTHNLQQYHQDETHPETVPNWYHQGREGSVRVCHL